MKQSYELGTGDPFRRDNHSSRYSKTIDMELDRKREDRTNRQAFDQDEYLELFYKSKFCSHHLFQAELQSCINV